MKNLIPILLAVVVLSSGCDPDGYSCNSEGCYAENNAQYLTLEDCLSVCDEINPKPGSCGAPVLQDGYAYSTVQIGDQCWFAENCRYLPTVSPSSGGSYTESYYYVYGYEGTDVAAAKAIENYETFGVLYNWPAVMAEAICPSGWHIPSYDESTQLTDFLGGEFVAGGKMKEAGYDHWNEPNVGATNSSGFTGLPGGSRNDGGVYGTGSFGFSWTSSEADMWPESESKKFLLYYNHENITGGQSYKSDGYSARCVQD